MARELGMSFAVDKGWVAGTEWDADGEFQFWSRPKLARCEFLWQRAIVHNDGGVAPCCGTFYKEDDFGQIRNEPSVRLSDLEGSTFRTVWMSFTGKSSSTLRRTRWM